MTDAAAEPRSTRRRWMPWIGAFLALVALAGVLRGFELDRFLALLAKADAPVKPVP